jgi:hypothetical protein
MVRGQTARTGSTRISDNGYHYTKTPKSWRLTHHLLAEEKLGRPLKEDERVYFVDKDRTNLSADNIIVKLKDEGSIQRRRVHLETRIAELSAELEELNKL